MSTDPNYSDFQPLYEGQTPREYHFFKIILTIQNNATLEHIRVPFYISSKFTEKWLIRTIQEVHLAYPREELTVTLKIYEVGDSEILHQHITSKERLELYLNRCLISAVLLHHWNLSPGERIQKFFKKIRTFCRNHIFIVRKAKLVTL